MPATARIPGFVSQRRFAKYMRDYHLNDCANNEIENPVSRTLLSSGKEKGRKGEYLVAGMFRDMGYKSHVLRGHDGCDVMVNMNNVWLRVEVKTAGLTGHQYGFHHIKTNKFDLISLVFVGNDYTSVKIGGMRAKRFILKYATWVLRDSAYSIAFNRKRMHCKDKTKDGIWLDFTKQNLMEMM